jgi:hypothetical protein
VAKILPGILGAAARGSVGSVVLTRGPYGDVVRELAIPVNTRSGPQIAVRASLKTLATRWSQTLDDSQRSNWISLASTVSKTDSLGQTYHPTGQNLYLELNQALKQIAVAYIDDAPASLSVGSPTALSTSWTPVSGPLTITPSVAPGAHDVPVIFATRCLSAGRRATSSFKKQLLYEAAGTGGPWDITTDWASKFGNFLLGLSITVAVKYTNDVTGYQSPLALAIVYLSPV